jgi:chromate transporter
MRENIYLSLALVMAPLSLAAIGGAPSIFAPMQHETVDIYHWLTAREFVEIFAVAKFAPGPGAMVSTLIGYKVAGWLGALVSTLALFLPSSLLCLAVTQAWNRHRGKLWHKAVEDGLGPIAAGLMFAGVLAIFRLAEAGPLSWLVAIVVAVILSLRSKVHPFALLALGAAVFAGVWLSGFQATGF